MPRAAGDLHEVSSWYVWVVRVFVYGTLLEGEPNHRFLAKARLVGEATTKPEFELRDLGGYPALVHGGGQAVAGEVYEVDEPTLVRLDRLEGHPRFYRRSRITLADGATAETYLLLRHQVDGRPTIPAGSWRTRR